MADVCATLDVKRYIANQTCSASFYIYSYLYWECKIKQPVKSTDETCFACLIDDNWDKGDYIVIKTFINSGTLIL